MSLRLNRFHCFILLLWTFPVNICSQGSLSRFSFYVIPFGDKFPFVFLFSFKVSLFHLGGLNRSSRGSFLHFFFLNLLLHLFLFSILFASIQQKLVSWSTMIRVIQVLIISAIILLLWQWSLASLLNVLNNSIQSQFVKFLLDLLHLLFTLDEVCSLVNP